MGLGFDFNPTGVALFRAPKPPSNKASKKGLVPSKPLKVQESRFPASEAKPPMRSNATRASEESIAQAKQIHAVVSKPLPNVRWIIPGLDNDDGRLHSIQASTGTLDAEDEMREARQDAIEAYEDHMDARDAAAVRIDREHSQHAKAFDEEMGADKRSEVREAREVARKASEREAASAREVARADVAREAAARKASERADAIQSGNKGRVTRSSARLSATLNRREPHAAPTAAPAPAPTAKAPAKAQAKAPAPAKAPLGATRVDWSTRSNIPIPPTLEEHEHVAGELRNDIFDAEEALEKMPRDSRSRKQLEEKLEWMKAQKARLYGGEGAHHPVSLALSDKLGLTATQAEEARKLGYKIEGNKLKKGNQFVSPAQLHHAIVSEASTPKGAGPSSAPAGHLAALRLIGGYSSPEAKQLALGGFNISKTASGATMYKLHGKRSSQLAARKFLIDNYEE